MASPDLKVRRYTVGCRAGMLPLRKAEHWIIFHQKKTGVVLTLGFGCVMLQGMEWAPVFNWECVPPLAWIPASAGMTERGGCSLNEHTIERIGAPVFNKAERRVHEQTPHRNIKLFYTGLSQGKNSFLVNYAFMKIKLISQTYPYQRFPEDRGNLQSAGG